MGAGHVGEFTLNPRVLSVFSEDVNSLLLAREYDYVRLFLKMKYVSSLGSFFQFIFSWFNPSDVK